jgi:uncharacterized membrane protein
MNQTLQKPKSIFSRLCKRWFIDAFGGMAMGLFATLIAGTIFSQIGTLAGHNIIGNLITKTGFVAKVLMGAGIGVGIAYSLKCDKLTIFSCAVAGFVGANATGFAWESFNIGLSIGNPIGAYVCALIVAEVCTLISGKTKLDILIVPLTALILSAVIATTLCPPVNWLIKQLGIGIAIATNWSPFIMGIVISVIMGILLTMPTSSAAIWVALATPVLNEGGANAETMLLAGGAAVVGCACHMMGFAAMSYKENGLSGFIAQGIGTSMLQIPNVMKNGFLLLPPTIASAILGPLATCVFKLKCDAAGGGMGTSGLVGVIQTIANSTDIPQWVMILGVVLLLFVLPALLTWAFGLLFRKIGLIKEGDLALELKAQKSTVPFITTNKAN